MALNVSNGLAGLGILTGSNSFAAQGAASAAIETRAVRQAKALFTTPVVPPPWKSAAARTTVSAQVSAIARMGSIVDKAAAGAKALPDDVQTAFTAYKALDRLRLLAESAAGKTATAATRASLGTVFARGLDDLQAFLGTAPSDKLQLSFAQPARRAESVVLTSPAALLASKVAGAGVALARDAPLAGLTGSERLRVGLSKAGTGDSVTVDLAGTPQPPTLDSVATAINTAIAAVPQLYADGSVALDAQGKTVPKWGVRFVPDKSSGKWGLSIEQTGAESVAIDQIGAGDALVVATGTASSNAPPALRMLRFDDPAGAMARRTLGTIAAIDSDATDRAKLAAAGAADVPAPTSAAAIVTDAQGFSYVVGTTRGDIGANLSDGAEDLFLSKLDSEGAVVWQRSLGASGAAEGAAVSLAPNGDIVVAGTVKGAFDGAASDGDMLVARFDTHGNETFATLVRSAGADKASAVAVGTDGAIFVGGKSGRGDAFLARLDAAGRLVERRTIDSGGSDGVTALAIDGNGALLALTREGAAARLRRIDAHALSTDLASVSLGAADARAIALAADGGIAVVGATGSTLPGAQVNTTSGGRDGFVARIDARMSSLSVTYLATGGDDQADSLAFMGGALYVGGRTTGALGEARLGSVDGFVSRIDPATGAIKSIRQFGQPSLRTDPVRIAAASGGDTVLGALGLHRGTLTPETSATLVAQTGLRAGDEFSIRMEGGASRKVVIAEADTLTTLAARVRRITGSRATVATPKSGGGNVLRIEAKAGVSIELIAGADGKDALAKLGLAAARIAAPDAVPSDAPRVRPGGSFGLGLTSALGIDTAADAGVALARIKQAISIAQTGYRSLYWDEGKANLVNGGSAARGASTSRERAQVGQYQAALDRLSTTGTTNGYTGF